MEKNVISFNPIEGIQLNNFKKFNSFEVSLTPGINHVDGRNGSGKSSILEAISMVLSNGQLQTSAFKDPHYAASVSINVCGKVYSHITNAKLDSTGKVTGTSGERRIDGVQVGVAEFGKQSTWPAGCSYLWDLCDARNMGTAQKMAFDLAGIKPFADYLFSLDGVAQPIKEAFNAANSDSERTVAILKKKANDAKKDAEKFKVQAEALDGQVQAVAEKQVVPAEVLTRKAELRNTREALTNMLQGIQASDETRKAESIGVAGQAEALRQQAANKRREAQAKVAEANHAEAAKAKAENQKRQAEVFAITQAVSMRRKELFDAQKALSDKRAKLQFLNNKKQSLQNEQTGLRNRWSQLQVVGVCPLTGQSCDVAASKVAADRQPEIAKVVAFGKQAAAEIASLDAQIASLQAEIESDAAAVAAQEAAISDEIVPTTEYVQPVVHSTDDIQEAQELMDEAEQLEQQANAVVVPSFTPSAEIAQIGAKLGAIATELQSIEATERKVSEANAQVDAAAKFNQSITAKIEALNADRIKSEENEAVYSSYVQIFSGYVRSYMDQATEAVNQLFTVAQSYLPGLRIKLFAEQMSSSFGKQCFVPQLVLADGSVSEALSDGENQLFSIALITEIYQNVTGVKMPILVDRAEAIDPDRLAMALADNQAIVATRKDCDLVIS